MKNLQELNSKEVETINGGSFGFDVGWFIANTITGNFLTIGGTQMAIADYNAHSVMNP